MERIYVISIIIAIFIVILLVFILLIPYIQKTMMFPRINNNEYDPNSVGYIEEINNSSVAIIYLHGNAGTAINSMKRLQDLKYDKYFVEYPSYSIIANTKMKTEADFWKSMCDTYLDIYDRFVNKTIILYGRSIGTGVVAGLMKVLPKNKQPYSIILETPIISIPYLLKYHIPMYNLIYPFVTWLAMDNSSISNFDGPVLIFGGQNDDVTPSTIYESYFKDLKNYKLYIEDNAGHSLTLDYIIPKIQDWIK